MAATNLARRRLSRTDRETKALVTAHLPVAVPGAGTIGLLSVIAAHAAGAARVVVVGRYAHQRERALALGADVAVETAAQAAEVLGDGADVVVETVGGRAGTLAEAVELVRPGGVIGMLGVFDGDARLPGLALSRKEARLVVSNCYGRLGAHRDFEVAVGLLGRHLEQIRSIVTHRFLWTRSRAPSRWRRIGRPGQGTRAVLIP